MWPFELIIVVGFFIATISTAKGIGYVRSRLQMDPVDAFEVEYILRKRKVWKDFELGRMTCAACGNAISFQNLGTLAEDEMNGEIEFVCKNPSCLELYMRQLEEKMWDCEEDAS
ncbi:MAG: hypothetical protein EAX81_03295 [Candidatus Thorarchaeota archaeon]|nr:hypothetical protein [Candidatus Thorarchaeota archaeon]